MQKLKRGQFIMNAEEVQLIEKGLNLTINPIKDNFSLAEEIFEKLRYSSSLLTSLTFFIGQQAQSNNLRVAAASVLYRELKWACEQAQFSYDLSFVKAQIVTLISMYFDQKTLRGKLEQILQTLVQKEYPKNWEDLLHLAINALKAAQNNSQLYSLLRVIYSIFKAYKFHIDDERKVVNHLICQIFPYLESLLVQNLKNLTHEFLPILNVLLKTFYAAIYLELNDYLDQNILKIWIFAAKTAWEHDQFPDEITQPKTWAEMCICEKMLEFSIKKTAMDVLIKVAQHVSTRFQRFPVIANTFVDLMTPLMDSVVTFLNAANYAFKFREPNNMVFPKHLRVCTSICVSNGYRFLHYAFQISYNYNEVIDKTIADTIIFDVLIYALQINDFELELFNENQMQYIYSEKNDLSDPVMKTKRGAVEVLILVCKYESEMNKEFTLFLIQAATTGINPRSKAPADERLIEGLMYGLDHLIQQSRKVFQGGIEELIRTLLLPQLLKPDNPSFVKARVCNIIYEINDLETNDQKTLTDLCHGICDCMTKPDDLYLSLKALFAMANISLHEKVPSLLEKDLGHILQHVFDLMKAINLDEILVCLKHIVGAFKSIIKPYAKELLNNLLENFWNIVNSNEDLMREEYEESTERAEQIDSIESGLIAMGDILMLDMPQSIYIESKSWVVDIFAFMLECRGMRPILESGINLFNCYLYNLQTFDDDLWFFYLIICYGLVGKPNVNFTIPNTISPLHQKLLKADLSGLLIAEQTFSFDIFFALLGNYVQKGKDFIITAKDFFGRGFFEYLFDIADALIQLGMEDIVDVQFIYAIRVLTLIPENCMPQLRNNEIIYEAILKYFGSFLALTGRGRTFKAVLLQKIALLLYLDSQFFMQISERLGIRKKLTYELCGGTELFEAPEEREILLMGLVGLYQIPPNQLLDVPLSWLVEETFVCCMILHQFDMQNKGLIPKPNNQDVEVDGRMSEENDEDDESWSEGDYLDEKSFEYRDPFEAVNGVLELKRTWEIIQQQNPGYFEQIIGELNSIKKKQLLDSFAYFSDIAKQK